MIWVTDKFIAFITASAHVLILVHIHYSAKYSALVLTLRTHVTLIVSIAEAHWVCVCVGCADQYIAGTGTYMHVTDCKYCSLHESK